MVVDVFLTQFSLTTTQCEFNIALKEIVQADGRHEKEFARDRLLENKLENK